MAVLAHLPLATVLSKTWRCLYAYPSQLFYVSCHCKLFYTGRGSACTARQPLATVLRKLSLYKLFAQAVEELARLLLAAVYASCYYKLLCTGRGGACTPTTRSCFTYAVTLSCCVQAKTVPACLPLSLYM
jgi:hypothetical protein